MSKFLFFITTLFTTALTFSQQVTTVAGYGSAWFLDGPGLQAYFKGITGVCTDPQGTIYVADSGNNRIRKVEATGNHMVSTIAGSGVEGFADGVGTNAMFGAPNAICIDNQGNLYVTDFWNYKIRKITPAGVVTTVAGTTPGFADGSVATAKFGYLEGICIDSDGNLFVADGSNNRIRKISPAGIVSTVAGSTGGYQDGVGTSAQFDYPAGICIDSSNNLFVAEFFGGGKIRKIDTLGMVTTIAGSTWGYADGQGTAAQFSYPRSICVDNLGNLFVADTDNNRIRKITPSGLVSTYSGSVSGYLDGFISDALFNGPQSICFDGNNYLIVGDIHNYRVRKIETSLNTESNVFNGINLFPNPNTGNFSIIGLQSGNIEIYDLLGQLVFTKKEVNATNQIVTELSKGIYLVKIMNDEGKTVTQKMVVD
ncbi:MAG: Virginiamycin lyase [Bacteroidota bacterium]